MINNEAITLFNELSDAKNGFATLTGSKFSYSLIRNLAILKPVLISYEEARKALLENFSKKVDGKIQFKTVKDANGQDQQQYDLENTEEFQKAFNELLLEEVDVKLFQIELYEVPANITGEQMRIIYPIIRSDEVETKIVKKGKK